MGDPPGDADAHRRCPSPPPSAPARRRPGRRDRARRARRPRARRAPRRGRPRGRPAATQRSRACPSVATNTPVSPPRSKTAAAGTKSVGSARARRARPAARRAPRAVREPGRSAFSLEAMRRGISRRGDRAHGGGERRCLAVHLGPELRAGPQRGRDSRTRPWRWSSSPPSPSISTSGAPGLTTSPRFTRRAATRPAKRRAQRGVGEALAGRGELRLGRAARGRGLSRARAAWPRPFRARHGCGRGRPRPPSSRPPRPPRPRGAPRRRAGRRLRPPSPTRPSSVRQLDDGRRQRAPRARRACAPGRRPARRPRPARGAHDLGGPHLAAAEPRPSRTASGSRAARRP